MKIISGRVLNDVKININLYELSFWVIFFFFIEYLLPMLLDPLGMANEIFGYEYDDFFELVVLLILPALVIYYGDVVAGYHYIFAYFFYGLLTAPFGVFLMHEIFSDLLGVLLFWICIDEIYESQIDHEGDLNDDIDDFSENYIEKK